MDDEGYAVFCCPINADGDLRIGITIGPIEMSITLADAVRLREELERTLNNSDLLQSAREDEPTDPTDA
jgi:hypothetical protein